MRKRKRMGQKIWHWIATLSLIPTLTGLALILLLLSIPRAAALNQAKARQSQGGDSRGMNINIIVGDKTVRAVLDDNPTSRDFVAMLPMTVTFEDFAGREKISHLSKKLSTEGRTADYQANVWDITYYVPWGNIAVFYEPYKPSQDLIKMGRIVSGQETMTQSQSFSARIELTK